MLYPKTILPAHTETIVLNKFHCWHIHTHKDVAMVTSFCLHEAPSHVPLVSHSTGCRGRTSHSSPSQMWSEDCNQPEGVLVTGLGMDRSQTSDSLPWSTRKDALAWADSVCRLCWCSSRLCQTESQSSGCRHGLTEARAHLYPNHSNVFNPSVPNTLGLGTSALRF